jgi:hypothetical protein
MTTINRTTKINRIRPKPRNKAGAPVSGEGIDKYMGFLRS